MGDLSIGMSSQMDTTVISNQFIDYYMPSANGEYVKIYLYLVRSVNPHASTCSLESMAQKFDHTLSYILNALRYWESRQVLALDYDENGTLTHITFRELSGKQMTDTDTKTANVSQQYSDALQKASSTNTPAPVSASDTVKKTNTFPDSRPAYSLEDKKRLSDDENFKAACFVTQTYFGKPLGPTQLEMLMYVYDGLGFDNDLIDFLMEYCVSLGKRSMRYAQATAIAWAKAGITSAALAKQHVAGYSRLAISVMKEFGISNRSLVPEERAFLDTWTKTYDMPEELILEACRRTVRKTNKGSFDYADSILSNWKKAGICTLKDVADADATHRQTSAAARAAQAASDSAKQGGKKPPFPQRSYDMDSLERQLLHIN